jgi:chromosome segregation ATPase
MALSGASAISVNEQQETVRANPIRKVVTLLQQMEKKVKAEGERDEALYEKFMCYCKSGAGDLGASIDAAGNKIPQVESAIKEAEATQTQLKADLVQHKADRAAAEEAVAKATALRAKEAATYAKDSGDHKTNIAAMGKAITSLEKGMTGFLQTSAASVVKRLSVEMDLSNADREVLSSYLSASTGHGYAPQSGEITGILKEMKDTMEADLAGLTAAENDSKANFAGLVQAKTNEIAANTKAIEEKTVRSGEVAVEIVNMKEDLDDTQKAMLEDKKFLADLEKNCATKKDEYDVVVQTRSDELVALADTIKLLNDDDALELFKKTLPSASALVQVAASSKQVKQQAVKALHASKGRAIDLVLMALRGKHATFDKVVTMIDEMVTLLGKEQADDTEKKAYCESSFDRTEDEQKMLDQTITDLSKSIEDAEGRIATLSEEIAALSAGIKDLDKQVADATANRQAENAEYTETMANNNAAKELIGIAKNRMNKFYNPKMYVAPPKRELSAEDRIAVNMGGTAPPTPAPGGIAGTGVVGAFAQDSVAPPPPPEAVAAYKVKGEESTGVIGMMDMLVADLDKEMQEMDVEEKDAQAEYETFMQDSADKRALDSASIAEKSSAKADSEAELEHANQEKRTKTAEAMAKAEEIAALHQECDWLVANFEARKEARAGEIDSLKKAKAVLSGADFALVQTSAVVRPHRQ